jgi:hypothetical protein
LPMAESKVQSVQGHLHIKKRRIRCSLLASVASIMNLYAAR